MLHLGLKSRLLDGGRVGMHYLLWDHSELFPFLQGRGNAELKLVLADCFSLLWWGFNCTATPGTGMSYSLLIWYYYAFVVAVRMIVFTGGVL